MAMHPNPLRGLSFNQGICVRALAASFILASAAVSAADDDSSFLDQSQQWSALSLKVLDQKPWTLTAYAETRFADADNPQRLWLVSEPKLSPGLAPSSAIAMTKLARSRSGMAVS